MEKLSCVLLIDDDDTTNIVNKMVIHKLNVTDKLVITKNGREGLKYIQECSKEEFPRLILLDINMPVMGGFEFLKEFASVEREEKSYAVIIMLTTSLNAGDISKANDFNISGYVNKPLKQKAFKEIMQKHFAMEL